MRIGRPLLKLPIEFCAETLASEVSALPSQAWIPHPQQFEGNLAVPLVSPGGTVTDDFFGPMGPTDSLRRCRYLMEIMQELDSTWGRSRLMALEPGAEVPQHVDIHYYWRTHLRIHIPVITNPEVDFISDLGIVNMKAGECWLLDSFFTHAVNNRGREKRVHLVLDTVGSGRLWDLIDAALNGSAEPKFLKPGGTPVRSLDFEQINKPIVMSPWEMKTHMAYIAEWVDDQPGLEIVLAILDRFVMEWANTWARYGPAPQAFPVYVRHLGTVRAALETVPHRELVMRNGRPLLESIQRFILTNSIAPAALMTHGAAGQPSGRLMA